MARLMRLPTRITITASEYYWDGGTITLHCASDLGKKCEIQLNQHTWNEYENPGRLIFNGELVKVRSDDESRIIGLLRDAEINEGNKSELPSTDDHCQNDPLSESEGETARFRQEIVEFVESKEYLVIAEHGVPGAAPASEKKSTEELRQEIIEKHGGISSTICTIGYCNNHALADVKFCFDHYYPALANPPSSA